MSALAINSDRLIGRLHALGAAGRSADGQLTRLAASDGDKLGRDLFAGWVAEAGLALAIDRIGNMFGVWSPKGMLDAKPVMIGSHIDTVINAGIFDGCYGVLAGLEIIETLKAAGFRPARPLAVAAFTNEEGVRYAPDMMGSLVHAGGLAVEQALATVGTDGTVLGDELARIGYSGAEQPGFLKPKAYVELHIEQGPLLERENVAVGAVENLQGISWQQITINGVANHAGTTPMSMRLDAGQAAARVAAFLHERACRSNTPTVATIGRMRFEPDAINVIPSRAVFTVDLRDPDEARLVEEEQALAGLLRQIEAEGFAVHTERLARFEPVTFDAAIVARIESAARARGHACRRMTSGAGHDAQMMARIAPSAMIFVPSKGGISHNPAEFTPDAALTAGAEVLLDVVRQLAAD